MRRSAVRLLALVAAVAAVHLLLTDAVLGHLHGLERGQREPERLSAQYVAEVRLSKPRAAPPPPPPPPPPAPQHARKAAPPQPAASQPEPVPSAPEPQAPASAVEQADAASQAASETLAASASAPVSASGASQAVAAASEPAQPAAVEASAPEVAAASVASQPAADTDRPFGFDWPQATRIRYRLKGNYRGEVHGKAEVEWLRQGLHYQVHVDLDVALVFSRRVSSDGQITASGLAPRHFVEEVKATMFSLRKQRIEFGDEEVTLANGTRVPTRAGLQDEASQFVQLTYEFIRHPERLQAGQTVTLPLVRVRSKKLEPFVYDVMPAEEIQTPMGPVQAFRLAPRPDPSRNSEWILELWFSPQLEYLPVRLRMSNADPSKNIYADLVIERLPERAQAAASAGSQGTPAAR